MLKKKIAESHKISRESINMLQQRASSEKGKPNYNSIGHDDDIDDVFGTIDVVNPASNEIDKKKLTKLRAK